MTSLHPSPSAAVAAPTVVFVWRPGVAPDGAPEAADGEGANLQPACLAALEGVASDEAGPRILLLYDPPVPALCVMMAAGTAPGEALREWSEAARALLALVRRHRRRLILATTAALAERPEAVLAAAGLDALPDSPAAELLAPPPAGADPVLRFLAAEVLRGDPAAQDLAGELEARAAFPESGAAGAATDLNDVFAHYGARSGAEHGAGQPAEPGDRGSGERRAEEDAMLRQMLRAQELAEERRLENENLLRELSRVAQNDVKLKLAQARLERIYASRTYRWTAPLRWLRGAVKRKKATGGGKRSRGKGKGSRCG
jgi:hypothetical protein